MRQLLRDRLCSCEIKGVRGCRGWQMAGIKVKLRGFLSPHPTFGLTIDSRSCGRRADSEPWPPVTNVSYSLSGSLRTKWRKEAPRQKPQYFGFCCFQSSCSRRSPTQYFFAFRPWEDLVCVWKNCSSAILFFLFCLFFLGLYFPLPFFTFKHSSFMTADTVVLVQACPPLCALSLTGRSIKKCQVSHRAKLKHASYRNAPPPPAECSLCMASVCVGVCVYIVTVSSWAAAATTAANHKQLLPAQFTLHYM